METFKLIKGSFSTIDAKEILLNMVDSKINFHKIKSLSSLVRSTSRPQNRNRE